MKKKILIIVIAIILIFLIIFLLSKKDIGEIFQNNIEHIVNEDIKKEAEKGIPLTNLNSYFVTETNKKTDSFIYEFNLNSERQKLKFEKVLLNNSNGSANMIMYMNDKKINIIDIINDAIDKDTTTSIIPKFYILGESNDELLLLEINVIEKDLSSKVYISFNNDGEIRNSFGGYDNKKVTDNEFLKAIQEGVLIFDHRIDKEEPQKYCSCEKINENKNYDKVISEKKYFEVSNSSLKLISDEYYKCVNYCN